MMRILRDDECKRSTVFTEEYVSLGKYPFNRCFVNVYRDGYGSRVGYDRAFTEQAAQGSHEKPIYRICVRLPQVFPHFLVN